jgi:hypothetical protein
MRKVNVWAALIGAAIFLVGCNPEPTQSATAPVTNAAQAQIDSVKNNPNMPDEVKKQQLDRLNQQKAQADAMDKLSHK